LIVPYIGWSILGFFLKKIYYFLNLGKNYTLKDFVKHLICGHILNVPLWYQVILILTTIFFLMIIFIFPNNNLFVFHILFIISYIAQYSGFNYYFFKKYLSLHPRLTFGRFLEAIPNSITGYTFAKYKIIDVLQQNRLKTIFFSFSFLIIISKFSIFDNLKTFKYGGIRLNIAASCIFILFSLIPIKELKNITLKQYIIQITSFTGGIYYIHFLVGNGYLIKKILKALNKTILGCFIIYLILLNLSKEIILLSNMLFWH
jgi:hypothetical protein